MYPIRYEADYVEQQGRWRTFFRLILAIPWYVLGSIYVTAAFIVSFLAWFALLFTGRWPEGLYNFNVGVLRFLARANAFFYLQTQEYPPFAFEEAPEYPVRLEADPPLPSYNRWKVFFRLIVGIPVFFMVYLFSYLVQLVSVIAWFHIVFTNRTAAGTHNALTYGLSYYVRSTAYFLLVTETFPPISDQAPAANLAPAKAPAPRLPSGRKAAAAPRKKAPAARKKPAAGAKKPAARKKPTPRKKS